MLEHHRQSIKNLIEYYKDDDDTLAVILGGSIAKGLERADSDVDAMIIVTDRRYGELLSQNRLSECITDGCTYEGGYFDIKYYTKNYLQAVAERGSEPARNAFVKVKVFFSRDMEIDDIVSKIGMFQKSEKEEKQFSFYSALKLQTDYFWGVSSDNNYLRIRTAADIALYCYRLLLLDNNVLFPCHRSLEQTVSSLARRPAGIIDKGNKMLAELTDEAMWEFVQTVLDFIDYKPQKDYHEYLTRFIDDCELWWYTERPNITEW